MKKLKFLLLMGLCAVTLASCSGNNSETATVTTSETISYTKKTSYNEFTVPVSDNPEGYKITYVCNNDEIVYSTSNKAGKAINPGAPDKLCATFTGWYTDTACTSLYNFFTDVTEDLTLYAGWEISYTELSNYIYQHTILTNVMVKSQNYKQNGFNTVYSSTTSQGSGVIFYEDSSYYYLLTNNHVCYVADGYTASKYTVYDCYNNSYQGELISMSADYDLALLKFSKENLVKTLDTITLANNLPVTDTEVIAMTDPQGLANTTSYGKVLGTKTYVPAEKTIKLNNITFDILITDTYINSGSSGGALLDTNLKLVGILFASAENSSGEFVKAYAIPIEKINEYIEANMK